MDITVSIPEDQVADVYAAFGATDADDPAALVADALRLGIARQTTGYVASKAAAEARQAALDAQAAAFGVTTADLVPQQGGPGPRGRMLAQG